jgi:hypothetical protein
VRRFSLILAIVLLLAGAGLLTWAGLDKNEMSRLFGMIYSCLGGVALLTSVLVTAHVRMGMRRDAVSEPPGSPGRSGLALLVVLLLMAFLSGIVIHSMIIVKARLRAGDERCDLMRLRAAALDAAWDQLKALAATPERAPVLRTFNVGTPCGITATVTIRPMERSALPPPLQRQGPPLFGQYFTLMIQATLGNRVSLARGLACRLPNGTVHVLSWWEHP